MHTYNNNNQPYEHNHIFVVLVHSEDNAHIAGKSDNCLDSDLHMNNLNIAHDHFGIHLYKNIF